MACKFANLSQQCQWMLQLHPCARCLLTDRSRDVSYNSYISDCETTSCAAAGDSSVVVVVTLQLKQLLSLKKPCIAVEKKQNAVAAPLPVPVPVQASSRSDTE